MSAKRRLTAAEFRDLKKLGDDKPRVISSGTSLARLGLAKRTLGPTPIDAFWRGRYAYRITLPGLARLAGEISHRNHCTGCHLCPRRKRKR